MTVPSGIIKTIGHPLCGRQGALRRVRRCDVLPFPATDSRGKHVLLYPEDIRAD